MNRRLFGVWGLGLTGGDFACAMAALGVLQGGSWSQAADSPTASSIATRLAEIESESDGALLWRLYRPLEGSDDLPEAFVEGWKAYVSHSKDPVRIEIADPVDDTDPLWILSQLLRPDVGAESIYLQKDRKSPNTRWHWPLRVGFLPDRKSKRFLHDLKTKLRNQSWLSELTILVELRGPAPSCDLLIIPHSLRPALALILNTPSPPQADSVIIIGNLDGSSRQTLGLINSIDEELRTNAIALAHSEQAASTDWVFSLLAELSHDAHFDVAVTRSLRDRFTGSAPVLLANRNWIAAVRLSTIANTLKTRLAAPTLETDTLQLDAPLAQRLGIAPGIRSLSEIGAPLHNFTAETASATTLAMLTKAVAPTLRRKESMPSDRRLQAQVFDIGHVGSTPTRQPVHVFRIGSAHRIDVRVGVPEAKWISDPERFPRLPESTRGHRLTVVLSEPVMAQEPQVGHIFLPPNGSSTTCSFFLEAATGYARVQARITVLYRNRVLQTSTLEGPIVSEPREAADGERISFRPEVVVSPGMADLDRQSEYGAALILNHTADTPQVMKVVNDNAELISVSNLSTWVQRIEDKLQRCDWGLPDFRNIAASGTSDLLCFLAAHGSLLYRAIVRGQFIDQNLAAAKRVQLIAAKPGTRLPVEYMYDFPAPSPNARICPSASAALKTGKCASNCVAKDGNRVCPLGFWGISRILEWHIFRPEASRELGNHDFALQQEKIAQRKQLHALDRAVVGASVRADSEVKNSVAKLLDTIKKNGVPVSFVKTWTAWRTDVKEHSPSILILIPHSDTDSKMKVPKLEIGKDQWISLPQLNESYVCAPKVQPIVLLLGCETAKQDITFEDFISNFACFGAAIIVSSSTLILGRQATILAEEFIDELKKASGREDTTFGDVVLAVRRNMLRKGYPMVLSVNSYGDADWRL